jgi:hypothetical protein
MGLISAHSVNKWAPQEYEPCYKHALPVLPSLNDASDEMMEVAVHRNNGFYRK